MSCHADYRDQILFYLAEVLDDGARRDLEAHLATGCPACAAVRAEAEAVLASLPLALEPVEPPATARRRLQERLRTGEDVTPASRQTAAAPDAAGGASAWQAVLGRIVPLAAAAGLAVAATAGVFSLLLAEQRDHIRQLEQQLVNADELVEQRDTQIQQMDSLVEGTTNIVDALHSSALQLIPLHNGEDARYGEAVARLLWDEERNTCHFFASHLAEPEEGKAYRLWLITDDDRVVPAGTFDLDDAGVAHLQFGVPEDVGTIARAGVSYDDADATGEPDRDMILQGHLPR
ncbi:MAG: anti-sigma factor [Phycisphaeraceae bacterium]